jgi:outer membrane protein assembly factor BamA
LRFHLVKIFLLIITITICAQQKKYELVSIEINGNNYISSVDLINVLFSKESPSKLSQFFNTFTSIGGKAVYFDSLLIQSDINALKSLYRSKGFFRTKIEYHYEFDYEKETAVLTYSIVEGKPIYFHSLKIKGIEHLASEFQETIKDYTKIDTSKIYADAVIEDKKNFVVTFLRNNGFMLAQVQKPRVVIDTLKNIVDIEIEVDTKQRFKISEIYTSRTGKGMDHVDDNLLREIVGIKSGDWYSNSDNQHGQVRLYRTNLFSSVGIYSVLSDTVGNTVPLNISADIGLMNELSPEIIMNNEKNTFNLGTALNFTQKNFLGSARKLSAGTSVAAQNIGEFIKNPSFSDSSFYGYADARITIEQPFLFGQPINTTFETYITLEKTKDLYNSTLYGAKLSFDFELPEKVFFNSLNTYLNIEKANYEFKKPFLITALTSFLRNSGVKSSAADSLARVSVSGNLKTEATTEIMGASFVANKTNDFIYPSSGYSIGFLLEESNTIAALVSKIISSQFSRPQSFKAVVTSTLFPSIYGTKTDAFGIKFKVGEIFIYSGNKADIPLNQRLYGGGSNSNRGWAIRELVPKQQLFNFENISLQDLQDILVKGAATGGFFMMEGSFETRHKFFGKLGVVLFMDYGNTWNDAREFRFDEVAVAAGFGLRFYSDFVPFRLDFGLKAYDPQDKRSFFKKRLWNDLLQIHLGIGEAF